MVRKDRKKRLGEEEEKGQAPAGGGRQKTQRWKKHRRKIKAENEDTEGNDRREGTGRLELGPWEATSLFLPSRRLRA